jgi:hypothetical protein
MAAAPEERDLRRLYFPLVDIMFKKQVDTLCEIIFTNLYNEYRTRPGTSSINITKSDFDAIFENSVSVSQLIGSGNAEKLTRLQTRLDNRVKTTRVLIDSDDSIPSFPIQFISPRWQGELLTWSKLFKNFTQIRISNEYSFKGDNIKAVSFGRPNTEVHTAMLNNGGCGLSALAALGIIGMDEYCIAVTNDNYLNSNVGTLGTTLYKLMLSDFLREDTGITDSTTLCAKRFLVNGLPGGSTRDRLRFNKQINGMKDYFSRKLLNNSATLLRFGDQVMPIDATNPLRIDEAEFGHSIVVFKENNIIYFFDGWLASLLTLKNKNDTDFKAKSWNLAVVAPRLTHPYFSALQEFTPVTIEAEMLLVSHVGQTVFEVYEIQNGDAISINSSFQRRLQEGIVENMLPRRKPSQIGRIFIDKLRTRVKFTRNLKEEARRRRAARSWSTAIREAPGDILTAIQEAPGATRRVIRSAPRAILAAPGQIMDATESFSRAAARITAQGATQGADLVQNLVTRVTRNGMNQLILYTPSGETVINFGKAAALAAIYALGNPPATYGGRSKTYKKSIKNRTRKMKY